jgi:hypothetical protein
MTVVPFRRVRPPSRDPRPGSFARIEPPPALNVDGGGTHSPPDPAEDRQRMRENLAAIVVVALLLVLGVWMIDRLSAYSRTMQCIESGHRNCLKIDVNQLPPR